MKKILLTTFGLAAMTLASCDAAKENNSSEQSVETREITIKVSGGGITSRFVEPGAQTGQLKITDGMIYVINAVGAVEKSVTMDVTVISTTGQVISTPVSSDSRVYILANYPANAPVTTFTTFDDIKKYEVGLTKTEEIDYKKSASANATGEPASVTLSADGKTATVNVGVSPLYARMELMQVKGGPNIVSFDVTGVYLDDYYPKFTLGGAAAGTLYHQSTTTDFSANTFSDEGVWSSTGGKGNAVVTPGTGNVWAYHVGAGGVPRFIIKMQNIKYTDAGGAEQTFTNNGGVAYVTVAKYTGTVPTNVERAKYYQVSVLTFDTNNLATTPNPTDVTLTVTAQIVDWSATQLTPQVQ